MPSSINVWHLLQGWCDLWGVGHLASEITVEISSRMTRSLGRCYPDRKLIRIAKFVLEEPEELFHEVLCHEVGHVAAYHLYGKTIRPHGREWQALMRQAGYPTSARYKGEALSRLPQRTRRRKVSTTLLERIRRRLLARVQSLATNRP